MADLYTEMKKRGISRYRLTKLIGMSKERMGDLKYTLTGVRTIKYEKLADWVQKINEYTEANWNKPEPFIPLTLDEIEYEPVMIRITGCRFDEVDKTE